MRTSSLICVSCLLTWALAETAAQADSVHLPCDKPVAATVGTGVFTGNTSEISFTLIQPTFLRLETRLFGNCGRYNRKKHRHEVTRRWFGSFRLRGEITPETSSLGFEHTPEVAHNPDGSITYRLDANGDPLLDSNGNKIPKTENTLLKAKLSTGIDFSSDVGGQLSVYDGEHFHLETSFEYTSTLGWNRAYADTVVAHALELDLDVTSLIRDYGQIKYRWNMTQVAATIAVPLRPATIDRLQVTPFLTLGYMWFSAVVDVKLDDSVVHDLEALNVNVQAITQPRKIDKQSPTATLGARLDFNKKASIEATAMFGYTGYTTAYVFSGSFTYHFNYPW